MTTTITAPEQEQLMTLIIARRSSEDGGPGAEAALPLHRLHLIRVGYLVMGAGLAVVKWPLVIGYDRSMPLFEGDVAVLLTAMSPVALLGLRYPIRLLSILLSCRSLDRLMV